MRKAWGLTGAILPLLFLIGGALSEETPTFDLSEIEKEIEKKPYTIQGFLQAQPTLSSLDRDSALYQLKFYDNEQGNTLEQSDVGVRLEGGYQQGILGGFLRADSFMTHDYEGWHGEITLMEGYLSLKPAPHAAIEAGKRLTKWGKGYAWNPVSFVDRPKNPEDPEEALEGYYVLSGDLIRSFEGPLKTLAFTPVILPVYQDINDEFGKTGHVNVAAKLYGLLWDTDLDLLFFSGASRTTRLGLDFSRNLLSNFEIHGEIAWIKDFQTLSVQENGQVLTQESNALSYLLGIRYLTENEITLILEYYHNGTGFDPGDLQNLYGVIDRAYAVYKNTGDRSQFSSINRLTKEGFSWQNPLKDYLYVRLTQKEPFDILYFTPGLTSIISLNDWSFSLIPELNYSPVNNLELRLRGVIPIGGSFTEYGEKQNDYRVELRARYYF